jgi:hypothetical protein
MTFALFADYHPDSYARIAILASTIWLLVALFVVFKKPAALASDRVLALSFGPLLLGSSASWYHLNTLARHVHSTAMSDLAKTALALAEAQVPSLVTAWTSVVILLAALTRPSDSEDRALGYRMSGTATTFLAIASIVSVGGASAALRFRGIPPAHLGPLSVLTAFAVVLSIGGAGMCLASLLKRATPEGGLSQRSRSTEVAALAAIGLLILLQSSLWNHFMNIVFQYW